MSIIETDLYLAGWSKGPSDRKDVENPVVGEVARVTAACKATGRETKPPVADSSGSGGCASMRDS